MRERLTLVGVVAAAAAVAAVLVLPKPRPTPPNVEASPLSSAVPTAEATKTDASVLEPRKPVQTLAEYVHIDPASTAACGTNMVLVDGVYCPFVGHHCEKPVPGVQDVCERFSPDVLCEGGLQRRRFCIDVFEYPNLEGVLPAVRVDWNDARRACRAEDKRLCTVEEWEFACEGSQMWPYPYGIERNSSACNIDRPAERPSEEALANPLHVADEVARLDHRVPSGAFPHCVSPFGVRDMTGNVDEWVENTSGRSDAPPFRSTLKGGAWGPVRARCRPMVSSYPENATLYQAGFRCCRDVQGFKAVSHASPATRIPLKSRMATPR